MPLFKYTALNNVGEKVEGSYTAGDRSQLLQMIRENGYHPVKIMEVNGKKELKDLSFSRKIKIQDISVFCRQFASMLNAGVSIVKCLDILNQQTINKRFKKVIWEVYEAVQKGEHLSEALRTHGDVFPELLINMIETGEVSGTLDDVMLRMATHFEKENKLKSKIRAAMVYPIVLSITAVLVVFFLLTFIMPTFLGMFTASGMDLPGPTRLLISISDILRNYWYIVAMAMIGVFYIFKGYTSSENGRLKWDTFKLRIPIVKGTIEKIYTSRFTRTLSTLLSSGIPLLQAMEVVAKVSGNKVAANAILAARDDMSKGMDLASPIKRSEIFPPMVDSMIRIGEESGTLDDILAKTADFYEQELELALQKMTSLMEPIIIIVMGGVIGFIVVAMAMPMFDMMKTIQ